MAFRTIVSRILYHAPMFRKTFSSLLLLVLLMPSCKKPQDVEWLGFRHFQFLPKSFTESQLSFEMGVKNPNPYAIKVKNIQADLLIGGSPVTKYQLDSLVEIPSNQPYYLPVTVQLSNSFLLSQALALLTGDSLNYQVSGRIRAGRGGATLSFPFDQKGKISPNIFR